MNNHTLVSRDSARAQAAFCPEDRCRYLQLPRAGGPWGSSSSEIVRGRVREHTAATSQPSVYHYHQLTSWNELKATVTRGKNFTKTSAQRFLSRFSKCKVRLACVAFRSIAHAPGQDNSN